MEGTTFFNMAELVREAALQEAATRSKTRSHLNTSASVSASEIQRMSVEAEEEAEELFAVYEDEKAKNDALARSVDKVSAVHTSIVSRRMQASLIDIEPFDDETKQRLEALASRESGKRKESKNDEQRRLEIEWQQLEFAIHALEVEKAQVPPLDSSAVVDIRTRAELHDLTVQYTSALEMLKADLSSERDALLRETQLQSDLDIVTVGLTKRLAQLQRKRKQDLTSDSAVRELNRKFKMQEQRFKELLTQLIDMGNSLFGSDNRKVVTLRHYLDELMNQAWDKPLDPWVSATRLAQRRTGGEVDDAMIELFIRANIIVAHPKDSRRWRLVAFHKPTRGSN